MRDASWERLLEGLEPGDRDELLVIVRRTLRRRAKREFDPNQVQRMSDAEVCAAFARMHFTLSGSAAETLARSICQDAYVSSSVVADVREGMEERILRHVLTSERLVLRARRGTFSLEGVTTEDEAAKRVVATHLVDAVMHREFGADEVVLATRDWLGRRTSSLPRVRALANILRALFNARKPLHRTIQRIVRRDAAKLASDLRGIDFARRVAAELVRNPVYGRQFERAIELKLRVRERVPDTPMEAYPLARTMHRRFVLHVGPTNSGKTHDALVTLGRVASGTYLGPLRLLAYEQFERLNHEGCLCSLLTGEEATEVAGARHVSSTVEMANFHRQVDVAVIDEAQMVADPDRGQHWTAAILGIPATEVHVCCAPHAEHIVCRLVELCGDSWEVVRHERLVPLRRDRGAFEFPAGVQKGDALVVFSRRAVHGVAGIVSRAGFTPSLIYGALPHDVRHEEARRFTAGETDVVVATDAIGMGMNLPIRRVVFVDQEKFDGREVRMLNAEEVRQIAGRAGRYGIYDEGLFQSSAHRDTIARLYDTPVPDIAAISVGIPRNIALVRDATLTDAILQWTTLEHPEPFVRVDVGRELGLIGEAEGMVSEENRRDPEVKGTILALASMPFDEDEVRLHAVWRKMARAELCDEDFDLPIPPDRHSRDLKRLEGDYRLCDLCYTYARSFDHPERVAALTARRDQISRTIMDLLAEGRAAPEGNAYNGRRKRERGHHERGHSGHRHHRDGRRDDGDWFERQGGGRDGDAGDAGGDQPGEA